MRRLRIDEIVSRREFGAIFVGSLLRDGEASADRLRVKAPRAAMIGEPVPGETWEVEGEVRITHWGPQLDATRAVRVQPTGRLVCDYLAAHVPGIGPDRAERLWARFGPEVAEVLRDEDSIPSVAAAIAPDHPMLGPRLAAHLVRAWREADGQARLVDWLGRQGFEDIRLARRIHALLGDGAEARLRANPYCLVAMLPWPAVDRAGLRLLAEAGGAAPHDDPRRLVGAADAVVKAALGRGDTMMPTEAFRAALARTLKVAGGARRVDLAADAAGRNTAVISGPDGVRAPGAAGMEDALVSRLSAMLDPAYPRLVPIPPPERLRRLLDRLEDRTRPLHPEQRAAALTVLQRPFCCLQGGAGVGKTYTTRVVCDAWEALDGNVLLCALAGKAALRLARSTGRLAKTLARTLGDLARREELERQLWEGEIDAIGLARIQAQLKSLSSLDSRTLVIVDEASMVDLGTLHALVRRMPAGARLLLVGDEAQLPPVGFGLVYHRIAADTATTVRLDTVHRQAAATGIPGAAALVRSRTLPPLEPFDGVGQGVRMLDYERPDLDACVEDVFAALGGRNDDALIVTATNDGAAGVSGLNARLHRRLLGRSGETELVGHFGRRFCVGEPVIHLRNDYRAGLFNGLMGTLVSTDPGARRCTVSFDGEPETHELNVDGLVDLDLAYAITCHKAQGSSARRVVIPIYPTRVLDPSWIYTAMTRAEEQVVFVGSKEVLAEALGRETAAETRRVGFAWPQQRRC